MSRRRGGLITTPPKRMRGPARTTSAYFDPVKTEVKGGVEDEVEAEVEGKITEVKAEIEGQIEIKAEDAFFKGSFAPVLHHTVAPHTLLLGTQPSDNSLAQGWYFATNSNAFWHIVGDALGFRASRAGAPFARWPYKRLGRGFHVGRVDAVDFIRPHLLHSESESLSYDAALQRLTSSGYAMWDVVSSSNRKGSLDSAIKQATFSDVESLVAFNPTIKRICFSTGSGSANMFRKAHKQWLREPGAFRARDDDASRAVFGKFVCGTGTARIELCVMESVSPACNPRQTWDAAKQQQKGHADAWAARPAALYPFKRQQWFAACFQDEPAVRAAAPFGSIESHFRVRSQNP